MPASSSVHINSEWVRQIRDCGLKFHTIIKNGNVTVTQAHGDVILEGQWMDVNLAINDIKDAVAKSLYGASDIWNHVNGSSSSAVDRRLDTLDPDMVRDKVITGEHACLTVDTDCDQMTATDIHQSVNNSRHATALTSPEMHGSQIEVDEYVWRYIAVKYPDVCKHWEQTLMVRLTTNSQVIEITGQPQDVINFNEWFKKHDLIAVKQRVVEIPSNIDVNELKALVNSSEAAKFRVCVRLVRSTYMECIGKASDINDLVSWLKMTLRNITESQETGSAADLDDSAHVNGSVPLQTEGDMVGNVLSYVISAVAGASPVTCKRPSIVHAGRERLKYKTAESQLEVELLTGDLTKQKSEVIVNPANKYLLHSGGAAKAIQIAAGTTLLNECKDYIRRHKELPTSSVMHTTSGHLPRPINYVIHACGPNARDYPDDKQCLWLLEKTFMNCFTYANDTLHVHSIALPAISSGITVVLHLI